MTPKEKHQEEQNELKTSRINRILESAFNLFSEKGIDTITMNDIAATAEIGVASLYRYFETKDEINVKFGQFEFFRYFSFSLTIIHHKYKSGRSA